MGDIRVNENYVWSTGSRQTLALIAATTDFDDTIDFLFPSNVLEDAETCLQHAFLSPLNVYVMTEILDKLPGDFRSLKEAEHTQFNAPENTLPTVSRC